MASNEEYQQRQYWENQVKFFKERNPNQSMYLVLSEAAYDKAVKEFGENCGYTKDVKVIRGYPKLDEGKNK